MRVKRNRRARKALRFYELHFGIRPQFKIILDGTFLNAAGNMELHELFPKFLLAETVLCVTNCIVAELRKIGPPVAAALALATRLKRLKCGHGSPIAASDCICNLVGQQNRKKYFVASKDQELLMRLREVPGVPLVYLDRTVLVLEKISDKSRAFAKKKEVRKSAPNKKERRMLYDEKLAARTPAQILAASKSKSHKRKRRAGQKEPNPLSVKKKKVIYNGGGASGGKKTKRKRTRRKRHNHDASQNT